MLSQFLIYNLSLPSITRKWPTLNSKLSFCLLHKRSVYPCWGVIFIQFSSWFMNYFQKPTINSHFSPHSTHSCLTLAQQQRKPVEKTHLSQSNFYEPEKKNYIQPYSSIQVVHKSTKVKFRVPWHLKPCKWFLDDVKHSKRLLS